MITDAHLKALFPRLSAEQRAEYLPHLNNALVEFGINTPLRAAAFLAQIGVESQGLTDFEENLSYSAPRLMAVWPSRFKSSVIANRYARQPEKLANFVYANRMKNGDEASGDGWKYRGRGPKQITGKDNYERCGKALGLPLVEQPDLLLQPEHGFRAAGWFWKTNNCNLPADKGAIDSVTRIVNGGMTGAAERRALYVQAKRVLG